MKLIRIIFSPTGGTRLMADALSAPWQHAIQDIDLTDAKTDLSTISLSESDLVLLAVPSYGGRVPALAAERIARLHGNGAACLIACAFGNRAYEDTLIELADLAGQSQLQVIAAVAAATEHSIIRMYGAGRPDAEDQRELASMAASIYDKYSSGSTSTPHIPGNRPYKPLSDIRLVPTPSESCNHCGRCARTCPAEAIDPITLCTAPERCISCMRCISTCPQQARALAQSTITAITQALAGVCATRKPNVLFL